MKVVVLGGSGFIGSALIKILEERGYSIIASTHTLDMPTKPSSSVSYVTWDGVAREPCLKMFDGADVIINLVGENISAKRWTESWKEKIVSSRVQVGKVIVSVLEEVKSLPSVFIQASAIGYYGYWKDFDTAPQCKETSPPGNGFLAQTVLHWEESTSDLDRLGIRKCIIRTAPVLGMNGGILKKMLPSFYFGLGSILGSGNQPFPWIHINDEIAAIMFLIDNKEASGIFNLVAPEQLNMKYFALDLGKILKRPVFIHVPATLLRLTLGEMAEELLLSGQRAYPEALLEHGFSFKYGSLLPALENLLINHHQKKQ